MRVPYSWLREAVAAGAPGWDVDPGDLEQTLVRIGHEIEADLQAHGYPIVWLQYLPIDDDLMNWIFGGIILSGLFTILRRKREDVPLRTAASRSAKCASSLLAGPTAKVRVSECLSQARPAQTVIAVRIKVSSANSITWPRLVMANCGRCGSLGTSAPMPSPQLPDFTLPCRNTRGLDRQIANCLKMNHYSAWL